MNVIIFSKDRAAQLDLLLKSIRINVEPLKSYSISVLYTTSNSKYERSYEILKNNHKNVLFFKETDFRNDVIRLSKKNDIFTMYGVDDCVFISKFNVNSKIVEEFYKDPSLACLSLRMHPGVDYCYTERRPVNKARLSDNLSWSWPECQGDWGYPMSIDFTLFRSEDIVPLANSLSYRNPNSFEGILANRPIRRPRMIMYSKEPCVISIPVNKVQTANGNHCGNISAESLNEKYLEGKRISYDKLSFPNKNAPHVETEFIME